MARQTVNTGSALADRSGDNGRVAFTKVNENFAELYANHDITAAETAAAVTPTNFGYPPGDVRRYGAVGDGTTVDDNAFTDDLGAHAEVSGPHGLTFVLSSGITIPSSTAARTIDLHGSVVRPDDNNGRFTSDALTATATSTVSSGASIGSRSVVVTSASSMAVDQYAKITNDDDNTPAFWAKITSVSGTTLEFDRVMPCTYSGTINIDTYSSLRGSIRIKNIVFDGSNVTGTPGNNGHAIRLVGFEHVVIENIELRNYEQTTGGHLIEVLDCVDVEIVGCRVSDTIIGDQVVCIDVDQARSCIFRGNVIHGGAFGLSAFRCESVIFQGNILSGRRKMENDESITARSVRGIKTYACGYVGIAENTISDYVSPIKVEAIHHYVITGNRIYNSTLFTYGGDSALAVTSTPTPTEPFGIIANNLLRNCGAIGIRVDSGAASTEDANVVIRGNILKDIGGAAIRVDQCKATISGNKIQNWNTSNQGSAGDNDTGAIWYEGGITAIGNTFENSDATDACFIDNLVSGQTYVFRDNVVYTANPYIAGGFNLERSAATTSTIASGATTVAVNHTFPYTPVRTEFAFQITTNPTNDPGFVYISAVSSTQVTFACRADPGAGGMNIHWIQVPKMPRTA